MTRYHTDQPPTPSLVVNYTDNQTYAALCVFEWLMDHWTEGRAATGGKAMSGKAKEVHDAFEDAGWTEMRYAAMRVAVFVEEVYTAYIAIDEALFNDAYSAYDWEFVPAVCALIDWGLVVAPMGRPDRPDVQGFVATLIAQKAMNLKAA